MKRRINLSESLYIDLELNIVQVLVVLVMFLVMFVIPVTVYGELSTEGETTAPPVVAETYTDAALDTTGTVAGVATGPDESNYITIPLLEIEFDTTLNDPNSIPVLIGGVIGGISLLLFVYLFIDTLLR